MKKIIYAFLPALVLFLLAFFSCGTNSPTVVNGTVVDKYTQEALQGVSIDIVRLDEKTGGYFYLTTIETDEQGKFSFGDEETSSFVIQELNRAGYLTKNKGIYSTFENFEANKINNVIIPMIPTDGKLRLTVENINSQFDTIFVGIYSPSLDSETGFSNGRVSMANNMLIIPAGAPYSEDIDLASRESAIIYWSFSPSTFLIGVAPYKDTIFIASDQTTLYTISF